jgi:pSer/pThr/pTyr-binding forkhead associated (FHA) protein/RNA polymerase subunit RPABC4/transcription elongation factor Spt4
MMDIGFVCDRCSTFSPLSQTSCPVCGAPLAVVGQTGTAGAPTPMPAALAPAGFPGAAVPAAPTAPTAAAAAPAGPSHVKEPPKESTMSATRPCPNCGTHIPVEFRFCGACGSAVEPVPDQAQAAGGGRTMFFGAMQQTGRARLILIKGEGLDGVSYHLNATEHVAGRIEGAILFEEDPLMSPRHANFFYRENRLCVRDEGSANGVFIRIRTPMTVDSGATFLVGEQLLQIEAVPLDLAPTPDAEGTYFYASPKRPAKLKLVQRLRGGDVGMIYRARTDAITIGREGNDVNFPDDPFISGHHTQVALGDAGLMLTDLGSKNGTFLRIRGETVLQHGDYLFMGQQLLRVEIV